MLGLFLILFTISCIVGQLVFQLSFMHAVTGPLYSWIGVSTAYIDVVAPRCALVVYVCV